MTQRLFSHQLWPRHLQVASAFLCGLALSWGSGLRAQAAPPETAPAALTNAIEQLETAASAGDIDAVMSGYSPAFTSDDGFTYDTLRAALETLWANYGTLSYRVELQSWEPANGGFTAETVTYIEGSQLSNGQASQLDAVVRSQQVFMGGKIVSQETISERNQMTSGDSPPTVNVILPEQVASGETYDFDAIVVEPLGDRYLLGAAIEEGATATDFFDGRPIELELLTAGGLFKIGEAPTSPDTRWISALLVREDGLTVVTRRLRVD